MSPQSEQEDRAAPIRIGAPDLSIELPSTVPGIAIPGEEFEALYSRVQKCGKEPDWLIPLGSALVGIGVTALGAASTLASAASPALEITWWTVAGTGLVSGAVTFLCARLRKKDTLSWAKIVTEDMDRIRTRHRRVEQGPVRTK